MNVNLTVCDEYSGLASFLANLIAKYADVLVLEDDSEEKQQQASMNTVNCQFATDEAQGSHSQASLHFLLANKKTA